MSKLPPGHNVGGFSTPSKMPYYSWSLDARECNVGSLLHQSPGSVCEKCYALKGNYGFPNVRAAQYRRIMAWRGADRDDWVRSFIADLNAAKQGPWEFRWFDSGDLVDYEMLLQIVDIAKGTPHIKHWLPTKEYGLIQRAKKERLRIPSNLVIRISAPMVDGPAAKWWPHTSTVSKDPANATCPAPQQSGKCGSCRQCWDPNVLNVCYQAH